MFPLRPQTTRYFKRDKMLCPTSGIVLSMLSPKNYIFIVLNGFAKYVFEEMYKCICCLHVTGNICFFLDQEMLPKTRICVLCLERVLS